jgi:hypothetical protein
MTSDNFFYGLVAAKFLVGLAALALGMHTGDVGTMIFGAGHAFVLSPLWLYFK